ncbi:hypothetical protein BC936DRAFT_143234 [Jimgerdemannia flammicorona]|uniref:Uncharacterized protein n=1 Tax=Jimgerdemannia flammicorona TaxID=994334 RepID=A0A433DE82_9FUNG|nr:hypothetical protein BC936DRAFT_143234 [Jimgerdemannia flammicorona]
MGNHDGRRVGSGDSATEWYKLEVLQLLHGFVDDGKADMRIDRGVPMAWKMLDTCGHLGILVTVNGGDAEATNEIGILPKGTHTNHRVQRVVVDIEVWAKIVIQAKDKQFPCGCVGDFTRYVCRIDRSLGHVARKICTAGA